MNFMSYVDEISRRWDKPNARDIGRMKSQPNAKGEMYILNDDIDIRQRLQLWQVIRAQLVSQLIHVLSMVPDSGAI